jgi:hypothetical protein
VTIALLVAGTAAGALVGFAAGLLWALLGLPKASATVAAAAVAFALAADAAARAWGRPRPLAVRTQVPREWSRLFSPVTTGVLYGARLGVGPLTILPTWLWWAATGVATSLGPAAGAAVGACFALVRLTVTVAASAHVEPAMVERMARLRSRERVTVRVLGVAALVAVVLTLAACSSDGSAGQDGGDGAGSSSTATTGGSGDGDTTTTSEGTTTTSAPTTTSTVAPQPDDEVLAAVLLDEVPASGFQLLTAPASTGPLDLAAAAAFESDDDAERQLLETRGFQRGYIRSWSDGAGGAIVLEVYRFATPEGASAYQQDGLLTLEGFGAQLFDVTDIPGAQGFSQVASGEGATDVYGVAFNHEGLFFLVLVTAPGSGASADDARTLATAQAAQAGVTLTPGG